MGCFHQHRNNASKLFVVPKINWLISSSKKKNKNQKTKKHCVWKDKKENAARSVVIKVLEICFRNQQFEMAQPHLFTDTWKIAYSLKGHLKMSFALWEIF